MSEKTTDFGVECKNYRNKFRWNTTQLAKKIGISQSTVSRIEQGEQPPSFDLIKKCIATYEIKDKNEQMRFLLSCLNSSEKIDVPLNELGSVRKEWLAALLILGNVQEKNPKGWDALISWTEDFLDKLKSSVPPYTGLDPESHPL
jgi:transcriptional regulator with XRE-family HTH domain